MRQDEFETEIRGLCEAAGLSVTRVEARTGELGLAEVDVYVAKDDAKAVHRKMQAAEKAISKHFDDDVRSGYYDAAIGYEEVPEGEAMLQFDCFFNVELEAAPAPGPR
jgi:hypothetical protein